MAVKHHLVLALRLPRHIPRSPTASQRISTHMVWHPVTLKIGAGKDFICAAAEIIELEDARSAIVLELEGAGCGKRGEGEERD